MLWSPVVSVTSLAAPRSSRGGLPSLREPYPNRAATASPKTSQWRSPVFATSAVEESRPTVPNHVPHTADFRVP